MSCLRIMRHTDYAIEFNVLSINFGVKRPRLDRGFSTDLIAEAGVRLPYCALEEWNCRGRRVYYMHVIFRLEQITIGVIKIGPHNKNGEIKACSTSI